jgi:hypothetical protein
MTARRNPIPQPKIDVDGDQLTVSVTFDWRRPWALDGCEVIVGEVAKIITAHFGQAEWDQLAGVAQVATWDEAEERLIATHPIRVRRFHRPNPAGQPEVMP